MATMAYWRGMTWGVSTKEIAYLESLTTVFAIETQTNADKEGESPTETVAPSLIEFSMNTTYRVETGTKDIRRKIEQWKALVGKSGPLIIGGATFGPDNVQLQSVGVSNLEIDARGRMRAVNLAFKFKEVSITTKGAIQSITGISRNVFTQVAANVTADTKKQAIQSLAKSSTVYIQPSEQVKANLKTVSMAGSHISSSGQNHGGGSSTRRG